MTKEEYISMLNTNIDINSTVSGFNEKASGKMEGLRKAVELAKELDEPKKVVIPQFVADWIGEYSGWCSRLGIVNQILSNKAVENDWWLNSGDNQELLLKAIANGYEVEKEPKYYVRVKGFNTVANYLNYDTNDKYFYTDVPDFVSFSETRFTKSWVAKNWSEYDAYNNAGLLEFEEVED